MKKLFRGCWPTMITPFTDDNRIDFPALRGLTEKLIRDGCDGIFTVCKSSEMFSLSETEKLDLARAVSEVVAGRVPVSASGHTSDDKAKQIDELGRMAEAGVDAVILVSNRLAKQEEGEDVVRRNFEDIRRQLPNVKLGMYECPFPYLRLLSTDFIRDCAADGSLLSLKDVSCSLRTEKERAAAVRETNFALLNANTSTFLDSLIAGYDGYNGVMGNFHIDLYKWLFVNYRAKPELSLELSDFLTVAGVLEARAYPVSAKYYCGLTGVPMSLQTREKDKSVLNENARREAESLLRAENAWRKRLGLVLPPSL